MDESRALPWVDMNRAFGLTSVQLSARSSCHVRAEIAHKLSRVGQEMYRLRWQCASLIYATAAALIAIMVRLVGSIDRQAKVIGLLFRQLRQLHADFIE